jgi:hypothetical protein
VKGAHRPVGSIDADHDPALIGHLFHVCSVVPAVAGNQG